MLSALGALLAWAKGWVTPPFAPRYQGLGASPEIAAWCLWPAVSLSDCQEKTRCSSPWNEVRALSQALEGNDRSLALKAFREARVDGTLARTDQALGAPGSVLAALASCARVPGFVALYMDSTAVLYEAREVLSLEPEDGAKLVEIVRLVMQGAPPPADRLLPEAIRRSRPTESL